jgi:hypothetical protein
LLNYLHPSSDPATLCSEVPYVPVGLFKSYELLSIPREDVQMVMTSSGTTGQQVSRIYLDRTTAMRQTTALSRIMQEVLGPQRLPMLIIDSRAILQNRQSLVKCSHGRVKYSHDNLLMLVRGMVGAQLVHRVRPIIYKNPRNVLAAQNYPYRTAVSSLALLPTASERLFALFR